MLSPAAARTNVSKKTPWLVDFSVLIAFISIVSVEDVGGFHVVWEHEEKELAGLRPTCQLN